MLERVRPRERIANYSDKLLTKQERLASNSKYIVKVNDNEYLDGESTKHIIDRYANYATSVYTNVHFGLGTKVTWDVKKKVWWVSIFANKKIETGTEVTIPYGKTYNHDFNMGKQEEGQQRQHLY